MCSIRGLIRRQVKYDSNIDVLLEYLVEWAIITLHRMFKSLLSIKNVRKTAVPTATKLWDYVIYKSEKEALIHAIFSTQPPTHSFNFFFRINSCQPMPSQIMSKNLLFLKSTSCDHPIMVPNTSIRSNDTRSKMEISIVYYASDI